MQDSIRKLRTAVADTKGAMALLVACVSAASISLGLALAPSAPPTTIREPTEVTNVPVTLQDFSDPRQVELAISFDDSLNLLAPASGVVTDFRCRPGSPLLSGSSPLGIDGAPILALFTSVPFWRDFEPGMKGADVRALQEELRRLGLTAANNGVYDSATRQAVRKLLASVRIDKQSSSLPLASLMWLPKPITPIRSCELQVGAQVRSGAPVATVAPNVGSVHLKAVPADLAPGPRQLRVGSVTLPLDAVGRVTDRQSIDALSRAPEFQIFTESDGKVPIRATFLLAKPMKVSSLPPSAIVGGLSGQSCVIAGDGSIRKVRVISSVLGRSLVSWEDGLGAPERARLDPGVERCS